MPSDLPASRHIGLLSTYPPQLCGLATFSAALGSALRRAGHHVDVVRVQDGTDRSPMTAPIVGELVNGDLASMHAAADMLSDCDVVVLQHEYGIFGGDDGDEVLGLLDAIRVPVISVLHTVPLHPTARQRSILAAVCARSQRVVVMSAMARDRLLGSYPVDHRRVVMINHGAATRIEPTDAVLARAPELLTWGLLGPGKGIEHVIDALARLGDITPRPRYTVAGVTHPKVLAHAGDEYRHGLIRRSWAAGLASSIDFDDVYRDVPTLTRFVGSSTVVVLPYDSRDQVTSGVLVDALAAGRPVIATAFPHAVEMLASGAGIVVPHGDVRALADAIRAVVTDPTLLASMSAEARRIAPTLDWSSVADDYLDEIDHVLAERMLVTR